MSFSTLPIDRPDTGADPQDSEKPSREERQEHPGDERVPAQNYAQLATRVNKAKNRDAVNLILDEGRGLPPDQRAELAALADARRFAGE